MQTQRKLRAGAIALATAGVIGACAGNSRADEFNTLGVAFDPAPSGLFNTVLDGRFGEQYAGPGTKDAIMHRKPYTEDDRNLVIDGVKIQNVTNQKALDITAARRPDGSYRAYNSITVRNYETDMVQRDGQFPGLHIDHLRIAGGGFKQDVKTDVYLENVTVRGGDAMPLLIQDGVYGTVHLKNVKLEDTRLGSVQISTKGSGSIDKIIIEDSPGLSVAVMERDNTVGDIEVINSPGARYDVSELRTLTPDGGTFLEVDTGKIFSSAANWKEIGNIDTWDGTIPSFDGSEVGAPAWDGWQGGYSGAIGGIGGFSVVPEPTTLVVLPAAALLMRRRRKA